MVEPDAFKEVMSCWASGVSVVAVKADGLLYGLTVSSFSSLSLEPPLILVCLNEHNRLPGMIRSAGAFTVSILAAQQEDASNYFARPGREPTEGFTNIGGTWTEAGQPVVDGAMGWLGCSVEALMPRGDHVIAVGRVVETHTTPGLTPLVYYRRGYHTVGADDG